MALQNLQKPYFYPFAGFAGSIVTHIKSFLLPEGGA
jgi:hypothetical protein